MWKESGTVVVCKNCKRHCCSASHIEQMNHLLYVFIKKGDIDTMKSVSGLFYLEEMVIDCVDDFVCV